MSAVNRPSRVVHGPLYARPVRGPDETGRWYWRVERADGAGGRLQCATGWWHVGAIDLALTRIAAGLCPAPSPTLTIRDLLELYLGHKAEQGTLTDATMVGHKNCARRVVAILGPTPVSLFSYVAATAFVQERLRSPVARKPRIQANAAKPLAPRGAAPSSVQQEINLLQAAWKWAQQVGALEANLPFPPVRVAGARGARRVKVNNQQTPTAAEVALVERTIAETCPSWVLLMYKLLASTACRVGEISGLQWSKFDPNLRAIEVDGKTGRRWVPLVPVAVEALMAARCAKPLPDEDRVFLRKNPRSHFGVLLQRACTAAGVPPFSPHGLRRYGVGELYRRGADPSVAAAITGHSPAVALAYYRQVRLEEAHTAMLHAFAAPTSVPERTRTRPAHTKGRRSKNDD